MSAKTLITKGGNIHFCQLVIGNLFQNIVSLLLFRFKVVMVTTFRNATLSGSLIAFTDQLKVQDLCHLCHSTSRFRYVLSPACFCPKKIQQHKLKSTSAFNCQPHQHRLRYTPNGNMADNSNTARDESHENEASHALMFCFDNASPGKSASSSIWSVLIRPPLRVFVFLNA